MKLTKYNHACFTLEQDDQVLVVDPGNFSTDFIAPENVVAIVITHEHGDHLDHDQVAAIIDKNPDAVIIGHPDIVSKIEVFETHSVQAGDKMSVGPFSLEFFGGQHAIIHPSIPPVVNLAVLINDLVYYPGDAFTIPFRSVDTLALPISAPWLKLSEAMDFLAEIKPRAAFPTHDGLYVDAANAMVDRLLGNFADANDIEYARLKDPIEI
jgi:L-ascorbate metabolism protein UlaG (beta-lactamase superfamily)